MSRKEGFAARLRREDGVSAVIVAISLVAIFGAAVLSVDAGSVWKTRRNLIVDTDAAALAAARFMDVNGQLLCDALGITGQAQAGAQQEAVTTLGQNDTQTDPLLPVTIESTAPFCELGTVRVDAELAADLFFAGIFGFSKVDVFSSSTAQWGPLVAATRVRPIGICDKDPHFLEWVAAGGDPENAVYKLLDGTDDPTTPLFTPPEQGVWGLGFDHPDYGPNAGVVHRVPFKRLNLTGQATADCVTPPNPNGNWGWLDFDPPGGGASDLAERLLDGYEGIITLGTPLEGDEDCDPTKPDLQDCGPQTGAVASTKAALNQIRCPSSTPTAQCLQFPIIVYDEVTGTGNNAEFHPVAFLGLILRGYDKVIGNPDPTLSYFDWEFVDLLWEGTVGQNPNPGVPPVTGVELCGGNYGGTIDDHCDF